MTGREWWPCEWADEVMPPGRSSPDDFIISCDGMWFIGYALDARDGSESEKRVFSRQIDDGDIVEFMCCDPLGEVDVTIWADGGWRAEGPVHERATHFWMPGDVDSLAGTMAQFVQQYLENEPIEQRVRETVSMAWWSEGLPHKFTVTSGSNGTFVTVSAAEARQ